MSQFARLIPKHYLEAGDGPPIVFIHGSYSSPAAWKGIVSKLATDHRCLRIALPGHNGTPRSEDFDHPSFAPEFEILDRALDACGTERPHLVGHSFGGAVALAYASRSAPRLRALTLFEPGAFWTLRETGDAVSAGALDRLRRALRRDLADGVPFACGQIIDFWNGLGTFETLPKAVREAMTPLELDNLRHWDLCRAQESISVESAYRSLGLPTRLAFGGRSNPIAHRIIDILEDWIPGSEVARVNDASHSLISTHAERCAEEIRLNELRAQRAVPRAPLHRRTHTAQSQ